MAILGLVLAAGAGTRMGQPKALVADRHGQTWLARSVEALQEGGVETVYAVVGASANEVRAAAPAGCHLVDALDWAEGMGASLRAGMAALQGKHPAAEALLLMLVDTPGVGSHVIRRVTASASAVSLVRASYDGKPGHPVLIGRAHWAAVRAGSQGDAGARGYLDSASVAMVECGDLGSGDDVDTPEALSRWLQAEAPSGTYLG
ncbi:MAG: nucleotidyltransferase family protein [Nocardioidaceae bacterium]